MGLPKNCLGLPKSEGWNFFSLAEALQVFFVFQVLKTKFTPKELNSKKSQPSTNVDFFDDNEEWLTNESNSHTIFQQQSARSSSEEEGFTFKDRLSHLHSTSMKQKQENLESGGKSERGMSPRSINTNNNNSSQSAIANNKTLQGMSKGVKVGLSNLENSYQNIKHKTPINQTRKSQSVGNSKSGAKYTMVEDHIKKVNFSATVIQRWFRRHITRKKAGQAAIQRLLQHKKQTFEEKRLRESQNDFFAKELEERKQEERKRTREEKAKMARQDAIKVGFKKVGFGKMFLLVSFIHLLVFQPDRTIGNKE
mgnify:CR=1 FL=1